MTGSAAGLLDTSTVINLPRLVDATSLPDVPLISTITLAELSVGPLVATSEQERARRQAVLQQAEADFDPLPFDAAGGAGVRRSRGGTPVRRAQAAGTSLRRDDRGRGARTWPAGAHQQSG